MTPAVNATQSQKLSFEDYLDYQGDPDVRYELWQGQLIAMPIGTILHSRICQFLVYSLQQIIATQNLELVCITHVAVRTEEDSVRIPDVLVCPKPLWLSIQDRPRAGVLNFEETPVLVIEVTSENWQDDYVLKLAEYAYTHIPGYWIVDPRKQQLLIMTNPVEEFGYSHTELLTSGTMASTIFPQLNLTVPEVLAPPVVETVIAQAQAQNRQQLLEANQTAEQERLRAEQEHLRAEQEYQRAEQESQRARLLADKLRELGIDPETLS